MKIFPANLPKFHPRNYFSPPTNRWDLIGRETSVKFGGTGRGDWNWKKLADNYAIGLSLRCESLVEREKSQEGRRPFVNASRENMREIRWKSHTLSWCLDKFKFRERERGAQGRVVASPKVTAEPRYICGNGKSTDTPKLMDRAGRTANPTLSLPEQIEFREDCVTLPPPRGRYFHFGQLSANIMLRRTAPNVRYVYYYQNGDEREKKTTLHEWLLEKKKKKERKVEFLKPICA